MRWLLRTICLLTVVLILVAVPVSNNGPQRSEAQFGDLVTVVADRSTTAIQNFLKNTLTSITSGLIAENTSLLAFKELFQDPLAWLQSKQLQQQIQAEFLQWLGGQAEGQNGVSPMIDTFSDFFERNEEKLAAATILEINTIVTLNVRKKQPTSFATICGFGTSIIIVRMVRSINVKTRNSRRKTAPTRWMS